MWQLKDSRNIQITIINKEKFEISKISKIVAAEKGSHEEVVKTTRRYFNYAEKQKVSTNADNKESETNEAKN